MCSAISTKGADGASAVFTLDPATLDYRQKKSARIASIEAGKTLSLTHEQLHALVIGLPWHRLGQAATIRIA